MTLLELIKAIKIDFTQLYTQPDSGVTLDHEFEISPKEFLSYSKQDFKTNDKRGNINALSNAKRAIDCQTDKIFYSLGLDPNKFPSVIETFTSKSKNSPSKKEIPIRLRFLQAMNFAPAQIISNTRLLRNKLEHSYKKPTNEDVLNAIELAELFILATDSKLRNMWWFTFTDFDKNEKSDGHLWNSIYVTFNEENIRFELRGFVDKKKQKEIHFTNENIEFYYLLKISTSLDYDEDIEAAFAELLEYIEHPIPSKHIKIKN